MTKGKKNEPRKIDCWNPDDLTFFDNKTKDLSFSSPYELERSLERLTESLKRSQTEPGLTPLEFILREFEDEAKKKLEENSLDSEELTELWRTCFDPEDFGPFRETLEYCGYSSLTRPLEISNQLQSAAHVSFCVDRVRSDISNGDAEQTAIDMLKLCFAAVNVNLHEMIVRGIRAKNAPAKGGRGDKKKHGIIAAIERTMKETDKKDAFSLWLYFAENHHGYENAFKIGRYKIFFQIDIKELRVNPSKIDAAKRGKLFEIMDDDDHTLTGIALPTFRQYVSKVKNKL